MASEACYLAGAPTPILMVVPYVIDSYKDADSLPQRATARSPASLSNQ